jgi:hypothetical protein
LGKICLYGLEENVEAITNLHYRSKEVWVQTVALQNLFLEKNIKNLVLTPPIVPKYKFNTIKDNNIIKISYTGTLRDNENILEIIHEFNKIKIYDTRLRLYIIYGKIHGNSHFKKKIKELVASPPTNIIFKFNLTHRQVMEELFLSDYGVFWRKSEWSSKKEQSTKELEYKNFNLKILRNANDFHQIINMRNTNNDHIFFGYDKSKIKNKFSYLIWKGYDCFDSDINNFSKRYPDIVSIAPTNDVYKKLKHASVQNLIYKNIKVFYNDLKFSNVRFDNTKGYFYVSMPNDKNIQHKYYDQEKYNYLFENFNCSKFKIGYGQYNSEQIVNVYKNTTLGIDLSVFNRYTNFICELGQIGIYTISNANEICTIPYIDDSKQLFNLIVSVENILKKNNLLPDKKLSEIINESTKDKLINIADQHTRTLNYKKPLNLSRKKAVYVDNLLAILKTKYNINIIDEDNIQEEDYIVVNNQHIYLSSYSYSYDIINMNVSDFKKNYYIPLFYSNYAIRTKYNFKARNNCDFLFVIFELSDLNSTNSYVNALKKFRQSTDINFNLIIFSWKKSKYYRKISWIKQIQIHSYREIYKFHHEYDIILDTDRSSDLNSIPSLSLMEAIKLELPCITQKTSIHKKIIKKSQFMIDYEHFIGCQEFDSKNGDLILDILNGLTEKIINEEKKNVQNIKYYYDCDYNKFKIYEIFDRCIKYN